MASLELQRNINETLPCKANMNMTIISRLSCRRAGTRFNSRGIDDEGNVANFVETETLLQNSASCFSFCQIRGSVPIFWEQVGTQLLGQKIQIPRFLEATQPAFEKHLESLIESYGPVHVINLLGSKGDEPTLSDRYERHLRNLGDLGKQTKYTTFDFHAEVRIGGYENANVIREVVGNDAESYAFYLEDNDMITMKQTGIFRTNCLDCLDRTNLIQGILSQMAIEGYLIQRKIVAGVEFWRRHNILWADNGDALSRIYAGTNALKTSYTRKGKSTFVGALSDVTKSFGRLYINQFLDKERQVQIDFLLGRLINQRPVQLFDPISDHVNQELSKRAWEFSSTTEIKIFTGTYNLNGRISEESIEPWLHPDDSPMDADLVAVGFQEIVELTAQQIVNADPAKRLGPDLLAIDFGKNEYVILRSGQLVGAALMLFGKSSSLSAVKNIECSIRKTGLKGMSGNKGGVSIRLDYENTRLCFITAHFAAGHANFQERDDDYRTIAHGLNFPSFPLADDGAIIWLGDFNYRIALMNDDVRHYINKGDIGVLFTNDQLNLQMSANKAFTGYQEAQITFLPTYKFDNGTDDYDSSEKQRIPAWTDRILSRGSILEQTAYYSAPLRFSDHRPVYALFTATITKIDEDIREQLAKELYNMRKTKVGDDPALKQPKKPKPPPPKSRNASSARAETFSLAPTGDRKPSLFDKSLSCSYIIQAGSSPQA
ncbi:Inositol-1,4,5-trisphosphate 5-phosphatase 1 [Neolecta irregularis DAH-3]|uniref:phosphoinositide 5-phosphatase n=1 Tax=Neolecta irregularis (strain DAH-3) TaxID=1198029 RepID=A0A1U7LMA5_NEOID|nr:Inositol-1,4,5-trisphosphate 5-phosphatase 1 [Neolecta irregularis DAH-3]|eukprot:OLL23777.1 Inositol-1,4,5-trisphosphate 5-phosphatase 1 [Neolecta irregularis DAH-3]